MSQLSGFSLQRNGLAAPTIVSVEFVMDSGAGFFPGPLVFGCHHTATSPYSVIYYLRDGHWAITCTCT